MAGIGFELRRVLNKESIFSIAKVYSYSALLSSGPWVISIIAILFIGFINITTMERGGTVVQFQIIITYAIALASSMIITGFIQLPFTRYIADEIFAGREDELLPAYYGVLLLIWLIGFIVIFPFLLFIFPGQSDAFIIGVLSTFLVLSGVWISNILAASLKYYRGVLVAFALSYGGIVVLSLLYGDTLERLIFIFFAGNTLLLVVMMTLITKTYASSRLISFRFFDRTHFYWSLGVAGLFYNLGVGRQVHLLVSSYDRLPGNRKAARISRVRFAHLYRLSLHTPGDGHLFLSPGGRFRRKVRSLFQCCQRRGDA
jgi:uncharacterized membrane protein